MNEYEEKVCKDLLDTYKTLLKKSTFKEEAKAVIKFNNYVEMEIGKVSKQICNMKVLEIKGLLTESTLYKYRVHMGIITDPRFRSDFHGFTTIKYTLIRKLIIPAQRNYYYDFAESLDLNTPLSDMYLSKDAYNAMKKYIGFDEDQELTFGDLVLNYQVLKENIRNFDSIGVVGSEITNLVLACGRRKEIGYTKETTEERYLRLLDEVKSLKNKLREKEKEFLLTKEQLEKEKTFALSK